MVIVAFEGWDAAGKGGAIRRLNAALDARGFTVSPIGAPTPAGAFATITCGGSSRALPPEGAHHDF